MSEATAYYLVGASNICSACEKPYIDCICDQKRSLGFPAKPIPHKEIDEYKAGWAGKNTHAFPDMSGFRFDPEQLNSKPVSKSPERGLLLAYLELAIADLRDKSRCTECGMGHGVASPKHSRSACVRQWFTGELDSEISFVQVCEALDFDPDMLRRGILGSKS